MLLSIICLTVLFNDVNAQSKSNQGQEFLIGFMSHIDGTRAGMSLYITSDSNTSGTVSIPGQNWSTNFTVTANKITVVNVDVPKAYISCSDCIVSKGVKVESGKNVVVYAHHYQGARSDATLVLPTRTLGKEYYVMAYQEAVGVGRSQFVIVAHKNNTKVNITPTVALTKSTGGTRPAGVKYQIVLDAGEVYQGIASGSAADVTGTHIEVIDTGLTANCRNIAVFSGSSFTRITSNCNAGGTADNLTEQLYPTTSWGNKFVLVPALGRSSDNFRFIAKENGTQIVIFKSTGAPDVVNIATGQHYDLLSQSTVRYATSNKPVLVAQFQKTAGCDGAGNITGDPSMTILNPLEQTLKNVTLYSSEFFNIDNHYLNIVIPTYAAASFRVDGLSVSFTAVPRNLQYSYARIQVSKGNHRLSADAGFIATAYGEGRVESYGYAAGANVKDLTSVARVSNSPQNVEISGCIGRPTQFKGDAEYEVVKWEWDFGDGNTDTLQNPIHTYADTGTYVAKLYTYKTLFDGCSNYDSSELEVTIYDKPIARKLWTPICEGQLATFTDSSFIPASEQYLFTKWTLNGAIKYGQTTTHSFDTVGKIPITMEVTTTKQCKDTIVDSLVVSPKPNAFFSTSDACFSQSNYFENQSSVTTGSIDSFFWRFDHDTLIYNNENQVQFFVDSGYHYAELLVKTDSGCIASFDSFVYKYPKFDVAFSSIDTCIGLQNNFKNTTVLEGGNFTDTAWFIGNLDTFYSYDASFTFDSPGTYTVQLVMEQSNFCRDTVKRQIEVDPIPVPDFEVENTCLGDIALFKDLSSLGSGSYTIDWDFDDNQTGTGNNIGVYYTFGGVKKVNITVTSDKGCAADTSKDITISFPQISQLVVEDICQNESQEISSSNSLGLDSFDQYSWLVNGLQVASDSIFTYTGTILGKNYVSLKVITKNRCEVNYNDSFNVFTVPRANFFLTPVCLGQDVLPTDNSTIDSPGLITGYQWFVQGVEVSTDKNPVISTSSMVNQEVTQVVESLKGCLDSITKLMVVYPNPTSSFSVMNLCDGDMTSLTSTSNISLGSVVRSFWNLEGVNKSGVNVNHIFSGAGDYDITLVSESDKGCKDTLAELVTINPLPLLDCSLDEYSGCVPFTIIPSNNSTITSGSIVDYTWFWGDGNSSNGDNPSFMYTTAGDFDIEISATSDKGCQDSMRLNSKVVVHKLPRADFTYTPDEPNTITEHVTFKDSSQGSILSNNWITSDGGMYEGQQVKHTFSDSGYYSVTLLVEDENGCTDEERKIIYVRANLFVHIPTSFTPNGDLRNDTYGLGGLTQGVVDLDMKIYNRWGELVFQSKDGNDRWDGTYNGNPVPQGVYLYLIRFTDIKNTEWYNFKGEIHLVR